MTSDSQDGLEWDDSGLQLIPLWTRPESPCAVSFYASGAFNKLYLISTPGDNLLMRVSLPVYPSQKTLGEVATLQWVHKNTEIPVPKVVAFDSTNKNEIGFEWILMQLVLGQPANKRWRKMTLTQKTSFVEDIAKYQAQLFSRRFTGIGTLHSEDVPGPVVSHEFFMGNRLPYDVPRGPFRCSHDWLESLLKLLISEQTDVANKADDDDDREDAMEILRTAEHLLSLLPKIFEPSDHESTVLWHDDLNLSNILVNDAGVITAIVDWECVSALPLWMATKLPAFVRDGAREEEPQRDEYGNEDEDPEFVSAELDNEGKNELYWIHQMEYDVTQLKKVYRAAFPLEENDMKQDFYEALLQCNAGLWIKKI
ncbi:Aminoglycoside 3'-phosphotransferase/choline kinase domain protein [Mycena indigotica]|uniref:Aminoglycoside 3'-phosphotransferase/choline kinase domain protein n=1 Tax=Mycena indigotica TaxID=2126181 RepID=A0A8H6TF57_9AGAR|nr:Aminoglycoside 3'-phosphotransferase/choline kinase domain protein [Mycena indigotica]KAF7316129.1 Aminoglycoside 3'-phosphotransferase/choline kinase domain protein [Mycena indigotica]